MTSLKESLTSKILPKEIVDKSQTALDLVRYYSKVSDIIERTHIAMGKKSAYKIESSSTTNQKLNTNSYGSTH
ncbi:MAG: hypothetical protein U1C46_06200 [Bacteroidales bacterium]|nr:hypothetical protein [Bacteroidales bacterium]MDZ4204392.1 hypothetical protein [Bacteroidales bacterium]